jgi:nucleoside-diphosphate-sugar epimerase
MKKKVLLTGSRGLIGGILRTHLEDIFDIYGLDIKSNNNEKNFKTDISNYNELCSVFDNIGILHCIVHLAGDPRVNAEWESVLKNNIIGTKNIYECARRYGIKKIIFASSNHVTGAYEGFLKPLHKKTKLRKVCIHDPVRPDSDYGTSKAFGEVIARQYLELYAIHSICLRIGWVIHDDNPTNNKQAMRAWLSHRDLVQLIKKSILADVKFGIYYGVSNNRGKFWDISNAEKEIDYHPVDDASLLSK